METVSDKRERIGTTSISEKVHSTYHLIQESGSPVTNVRVETVKDGNPVASSNVDVNTNRMFISISDYKYLTKEERLALVTSLINDLDDILNEPSV